MVGVGDGLYPGILACLSRGPGNARLDAPGVVTGSDEHREIGFHHFRDGGHRALSRRGGACRAADNFVRGGH